MGTNYIAVAEKCPKCGAQALFQCLMRVEKEFKLGVKCRKCGYTCLLKEKSERVKESEKE